MNIPDGVSTTWWVGRISDICFQFNASKLKKMIRISQHQSSGCESAAARVLILAAMKHMSLSQSWGRIIKSNIFSDWGTLS
jgi:hypothetical protein